MKVGDPGYWEWRKKVGKPKAIESETKLWELACEYFQRADETPFKKEELIKGGMFAGDKGVIKIDRPYTWAGFEAFLFEKGIICKLDDYKVNATGSYDKYQDVLRAISNIMKEQNLGGAAVNIFNSGIISAIQGLAKKIENTVTIEQPLFPEESTGKTFEDKESLLD